MTLEVSLKPTPKSNSHPGGDDVDDEIWPILRETRDHLNLR